MERVLSSWWLWGQLVLYPAGNWLRTVGPLLRIVLLDGRAFSH